MFNKTITYTLIITFLIISICIWTFFIAPIFKKMPPQFSYNADLLSLDNFYDQDAKKFAGAHISKSTFSYQLVGIKNNDYVIKNLFNVKTLSDKPIISIERTYLINPYSWQHTTSQNNEKEFLFAPHYVHQKDFEYFHVNYNVPAKMHFIKNEKISGLNVNVYRAQFQADQTESLHHLQNVPQKYNILTDVILTLWIEPISGWLIKYQDDSIAYYYDKNTRHRISPWNKFSNRYTETSLNQQVENARILKFKFIMIDFVVPLVILFSGILFIVYLNINLKKEDVKPILNKFIFLQDNLLTIFYILLIIAVATSVYVIFLVEKFPSQFTIGISIWNNTPEFQETVKGFKDELSQQGFIEGKNISYLISSPDGNVQNQIDIIQNFINKNVNLIFTLTTPGTLIAKGMTSQIPIVFSETMYPEATNIIKSLGNSGNNLVGTLDYIFPAKQFYPLSQLYPNITNFLFIHQTANPDSEIQFQEYKKILQLIGIQMVELSAIDAADLQRKLLSQKTDAIFLACDSVQQDVAKVTIEYANKNKIPILTCDKQAVFKGALLGYLIDHYTIGKMAGKKAAFILQGAEPSWLSTQAPTKNLFIINKKSADYLGITLPKSLLDEATEIIEK